MASTRPNEIPEQELIIKTSNKITSAMASDQPFYLTFKQVQKLFNSQKACAYSGEMFGTIGDITFERVNPRIGYVQGNVVLVKHHINQLKGATIDRFIHQSGMTTDALADLFTTLARSLRKEFAAEQEQKAIPISKLESRIAIEIAAANPANGAVSEVIEEVGPKPELTKGQRLLMNTFAAAKKKREKMLNETE